MLVSMTFAILIGKKKLIQVEFSPDVLAVELDTDVQTALGSNGVLTSSSCSTLGRGQHGVHESLESLVHLVVLCLLVAGLDVVDDVVVEDIPKNLVTAAEESEEEGKEGG